mmetsp:Transcript_124848/g.388645  ORF Transcript_124848/g.388645 Transcript_124848/m.388645 type:complete len:427 (+) Transcript_124848:76-1356(+)
MHWAPRGALRMAMDGSPQEGATGEVNGAGVEGHALVVWVAFIALVPLLVALDFLCIGERRREEVSITTASWQCAFWIATGLAFNVFVWYYLGVDEGISWLSGYVLEYMLSVDNLFCFHLIFMTYGTPKDQTHRALVYGIGGAVVLRFLLFAVGAGMFNTTRLFHWIFGFILLYSGVKVMAVSEEAETDHKQNWAVKQISRVLPVHDGYAPNAAFFLRGAPLAEAGRQDPAQEEPPPPQAERCSLALRGEGARDVEMPAAAGCGPAEAGLDHAGLPSLRRGEVKATLLFLVVITLWAVDLIFALDSVAAKVSMVSQFEDQIDLVINFTSSAFCMLTLRSLYFLLASLVHVFALIKYGVGLILILIGLRLMLSTYVEVSEGLFCGVMLGIFALSIVASVVVPRPVPTSTSAATELSAPMAGRTAALAP